MTMKFKAAAKLIRTLIVLGYLLTAHSPATSQEPPSSTGAQVPQPQVPQHTTPSVSLSQQRAELQAQWWQHWLNGELTPAIERMQQLIELESSLFGSDSQRIVPRYETLSELYLETGDVQQAEASIHRASQILRANYPPTSWQAVEADRKQEVFKRIVAIPAVVRQAIFDVSREVEQHYESLQFGEALIAAEKQARLVGEQFGERHPIWITAIATIDALHMAQGNWENIGPQLEMLYGLLEQVEHPDHPDFGRLLWLLADHARLVGDPGAALRYGSAAVEQYERANATDDPGYAIALGQFATTLYDQGDLEQSIPILRKAFSAWTDELAMHEEDQKMIGDYLCQALEDSGLREFKLQRWDPAEAAFGEAQQVANQTRGESDYRSQDIGFEWSLVQLARQWTTTELANFDELVTLESTVEEHVSQANFPEAIDVAQQRLAIAQNLLGTDAAWTLTIERELFTWRMLYGTFSTSGRQQFIPELTEFIARHQQRFGSNHPNHAELCLDAAEFLSESDPLAVDFARQSMEAYQEAFTRTSEEYLVARTVLGIQLATQNDERCIEILEDSIAFWEAGPSAGCFRHCTATTALGGFYYDIGQYYDARIQLANAVAIIRENDEMTAIELADALNNLANIYSDYEDYGSALVYYREALAIYRQPDPAAGAAQSPPSDWLLYNTARSCYHTQQVTEAEKLLSELVHRFPETPLSDEDAFRSGCYYLTKVLLKLGKIDLATQTLRKASDAVEMHFSEDFQVFAEMLLENAELHATQNQTDATRKFLDQAFEKLSSQTDLSALPAADARNLFRLLDRLIAICEDIGAWEKSAEVRGFSLPLVDEFFSEGWGWIVVLERQQLAEVKRIAQSSPEQQAQIRELQKRTKYLADNALSDYRSFKPADLSDLAACYESCVEVLGETSLIAANYRQQVAVYFEHQQQYLTAIKSQQYAVETYLQLLGETHPHTARAGVKMARIGRQIGVYKQSKQMLDAAIRALKDIQGEQSSDTLEATLELAKLLVDVRDYAAALPLARTVEDTLGRLWGKNSVHYANALGVLGEVYYGMNEFDLSADYMTRSHQLLEDLLEPFDRRLLRSAARAAIANTWSLKKAEFSTEPIEQVLEAYAESQQTELVDYVELLVDYGDVLVQQNKFEEAEAVFARASDSVVELDGRGDDIMRAAINSRLGSTQRKLGKLAAASESLASASETQRRIFGDQSQTLCETLFQQAIAAQLAGDAQRATALVLESLRIEQKLLGDLGYLLSDKSLSSMLTADENRLSLLLRGLLNSERDSETVAQGFYWTHQRKGMALDLSCRLRKLQRSRLYDSNVVRLAGRVRLLNQELADLALLPTQQQTLQEIRQQQASIAREIATTNSALSLALHGAGAEVAVDLMQTENDLTAVQKSLPAGTLFLEYVRLDGFVNSLTEKQSPRYVAFLVQSDTAAPIQMADLGKADEIDGLIDEMRVQTRGLADALSISSEAALEDKHKQLASRLYATLLGPFATHLAECQILIVSPDANLSSVPFSALVGDDGQYLVERLDISYVSSSRDLLRPAASIGRGTLILADPNFDAGVERRREAAKEIDQQTDTRSLLVTRGSAESDLRSLRSLRWRRLPGAEGEANEIAEILTGSEFGPVKKYLDNQAIEEVLQGAQSPRIVHLATHGFYVPLEDELRSADFDSRAIGFTSGLARLRTDSNPLMRSGIVLAGANRVTQSKDAEITMEDGWVTALEIASMDFQNTELVVLSACESGLGDVSSGQGLQGIRRAFTSAGAHSVITSLFEVPDAETRDLMRGFYQTFATTKNRVSAINSAQRQQIALRRQEFDAAHPYFWASFVISGGAPQPK
ncbi:MAG: CHAT domain-containing tetratricopeptide repeat protein [Pirellulaceae bacterium]